MWNILKLISKVQKNQKLVFYLSSICNLFWWSWYCWNSWQKLVKITIILSVHLKILYCCICSIIVEISLKNWTQSFLQKSKYTSYKNHHILQKWYGYFANIYVFFARFQFWWNPTLPKVMHFNALLLSLFTYISYILC